MRDVTWAKEYVLPIQITGKPHWLNEDASADENIGNEIRLVQTPEKQSGEFMTWAGQQANSTDSLADIRHFQRLAEMLTVDGSGLIEGRYSHFVLAGIVFEQQEQMRSTRTVTVAGKTTEEPEILQVNVRYVPVMNLFRIDGKPVWGVALYPANQYNGRLGGPDTALVCIP